MGLKDKLIEGMDKAKGVVQSSVEKAQEKHAESQRIKQLPCVICGKPVGGWMWQHRIKGEDTYVCNNCFAKLPESMAGSKQCEEFNTDDIRIGLAYAEENVDPDDLTVEHTGFHVTDYLGALWIDEDRLLFTVGKYLDRMPKDEDLSPYMPVYSFAWLEDLVFTLYDITIQDDLRARRACFDISLGFTCRTPYPIPSGLSIELEPTMAVIHPRGGTIDLKRKLRTSILNETWTDLIKERVRYTDPPEAAEMERKLLALAAKAGAKNIESRILHKKV